MIEYNKIKTKRSDFISVGWYIGSVCNYNCSYCPEMFHNGKDKFPEDLVDIKRFIEKVREKYPDKIILFTLIGGEPTFWNLIEEFCDLCKNNNAYIRVITNGSRGLKWWEKNAKYFHRIIVSYHNEHIDDEYILELMKMLSGKTQMNLMIPPEKEKFNKIIETGKKISNEAKIFVLPKYLRINMSEKLYDYDDDQLKVFKYINFGSQYLDSDALFWFKGFELHKSDNSIIIYSNTRKLCLDGLNKWKGWKCWGGIDSFFIDRCNAIYVGQCRNSKIADFKGIYELPEEPYVCQKDFCNCAQDIIDSNKEKII